MERTGDSGDFAHVPLAFSHTEHLSEARMPSNCPLHRTIHALRPFLIQNHVCPQILPHTEVRMPSERPSHRSMHTLFPLSGSQPCICLGDMVKASHIHLLLG